MNDCSQCQKTLVQWLFLPCLSLEMFYIGREKNINGVFISCFSSFRESVSSLKRKYSQSLEPTDSDAAIEKTLNEVAKEGCQFLLDEVFLDLEVRKAHIGQSRISCLFEGFLLFQLLPLIHEWIETLTDCSTDIVSFYKCALNITTMWMSLIHHDIMFNRWI